MKAYKQLVKFFLPIVIIFVMLFIMHFKTGVDKYVAKSVENVDNLSAMYEVHNKWNKYQVDGPGIIVDSPEFEKIYNEWGTNFGSKGWVFKSVLNGSKEIKNFDFISYVNYEAPMMAVPLSEGDEYGSVGTTVDLSLLDDSQKKRVIEILRENYQEKITIEVSGEIGVDGAYQDENQIEPIYMYTKITASYLKMNDEVIIDQGKKAVEQMFFFQYHDQDCFISTGYTAQYENAGMYVDIAQVKKNTLSIMEEVMKTPELGWQGKKIEIDGNYYLYDLIEIYDDVSGANPKYLVSVTVIPDLRSEMASEFIDDNIMLYVGTAIMLIVSIIVTQLTIFAPTKKLLQHMNQIQKDNGVENTVPNTFKGTVKQMETIDQYYQEKIGILNTGIFNLQQQLQVYKPSVEIVEEDSNPIDIMVDSIIQRYNALLENKKVKTTTSITTKETIYSIEDLQSIINQVLHKIVYQVDINGEIEIVISNQEVAIEYSITVKNIKENIKEDKKIQEILEKDNSHYKIEIKDKKIKISFSK